MCILSSHTPHMFNPFHTTSLITHNILLKKTKLTSQRDSITEALIQKHKEYARKPQPALKNMVEKGL